MVSPVWFRTSGVLGEDWLPDPELCEDANPEHLITRTDDDAIFVADGMGGASRGYGGHTGGYWASRLVSQAAIEFFADAEGETLDDISCVSFSERLTATAHMRLAAAAEENIEENGRLRGRLAHYRLGSTLAGALVSKNRTKARVFWIGDSRVYWLSATSLHQLSVDDVENTAADALELLVEDPPMSQFLAANMNPEWRVHVSDVDLGSGVLIAATDGCFGYWSAPWEFELALVNAFTMANSWSSWIALVQVAIGRVVQDDASMIAFPLDDDYAAFRAQIMESGTSRPCMRASAEPDRSPEGLRRTWLNIYKSGYEARADGGAMRANTTPGAESQAIGEQEDLHGEPNTEG